MDYKIDGEVEICSAIKANELTEETKSKFKKEFEESITASFDELISRYNFKVESVHDVFLKYLDFEEDIYDEDKKGPWPE